jgi:GNAT superfamily N-acetyltransferase
VSVEVRPVAGRGDRDAFIHLPWRIYESDPLWVPPLIRDVRTMLDPEKHPFHLHSEMELYLAHRDGVPVGRIAAIHNRRHVDYHHEPVGFFGFFECEDDPEVAAALFEAAASWLRARGLEVMRGPTSPSTNDVSGLLVEGLDEPPMVMMAYNPPYYLDLLTGAGFREAKGLVAYVHRDQQPPDYLVRGAGLVQRRYGVSVRSLRMKEFDRELELVQELYNAAWQDNWGFVPMTDEEFRFLAKELKPAVDPDLVLIAEDSAGEPIGFALCLPDFNVALKHANGRLFPFGLIKILWHARHIHRMRVLTLGLVEAWRGKGVDALMYLEIFRRGTARGITEAEFSWILEDNEMMRRPMDRIGASVYKRYALYDRAL